jgi:hypothetical protein
LTPAYFGDDLCSGEVEWLELSEVPDLCIRDHVPDRCILGHVSDDVFNFDRRWMLDHMEIGVTVNRPNATDVHEDLRDKEEEEEEVQEETNLRKRARDDDEEHTDLPPAALPSPVDLDDSVWDPSVEGDHPVFWSPSQRCRWIFCIRLCQSTLEHVLLQDCPHERRGLVEEVCHSFKKGMSGWLRHARNWRVFSIQLSVAWVNRIRSDPNFIQRWGRSYLNQLVRSNQQPKAIRLEHVDEWVRDALEGRTFVNARARLQELLNNNC